MGHKEGAYKVRDLEMAAEGRLLMEWAESRMPVLMSLREKYAKIHEDTIAWIKAQTDMKVVDLTDAQRAEWRKAAEPVVDFYIKQSGPLGEKLISEARKLQ